MLHDTPVLNISPSKHKVKMDETLRMTLTVSKYREDIDDNKPSWISITTITMFAKQLIAPIPLKELKAKLEGRHFEIPNGPTWAYRPPKKAKDPKKKDFYNSISIGYRDTTTKSMKIFPNGSMQLTGATDPKEGKCIFTQAVKVIKAAYGIDDSDTDYSKIKIAMINTNFCMGFTLDLDTVNQLFNDKDYQSTYTPDTYSAVTVRFYPIEGRKRVTVNIFNSGSVIITGAESLKEITAAYLVINRLLRKHYDDVYNPHCKVNVKEKKSIKFNKILKKAQDSDMKMWEDI
jgi:TATA-box binding protein (TBP) (component of TFIID and TFIIIB)